MRGGIIFLASFRARSGRVLFCGRHQLRSKRLEDTMALSRRTFLKGALTGGAAFSLLGFDLTPAVRPAPRTQDCARHRNPFHLPLLFRELRRHYLHDRRQSQERDAAGDSCGRRPRPSHQSRHALPQGRFARARHPESTAAAEAAGAPARRTDWEDISWDQAH